MVVLWYYLTIFVAFHPIAPAAAATASLVVALQLLVALTVGRVRRRVRPTASRGGGVMSARLVLLAHWPVVGSVEHTARRSIARLRGRRRTAKTLITRGGATVVSAIDSLVIRHGVFIGTAAWWRLHIHILVVFVDPILRRVAIAGAVPLSVALSVTVTVTTAVRIAARAAVPSMGATAGAPVLAGGPVVLVSSLSAAAVPIVRALFVVVSSATAALARRRAFAAHVTRAAAVVVTTGPLAISVPISVATFAVSFTTFSTSCENKESGERTVKLLEINENDYNKYCTFSVSVSVAIPVLVAYLEVRDVQAVCTLAVGVNIAIRPIEGGSAGHSSRGSLSERYLLVHLRRHGLCVVQIAVVHILRRVLHLLVHVHALGDIVTRLVEPVIVVRRVQHTTQHEVAPGLLVLAVTFVA